MHFEDLGSVDYRAAWEVQREAHAAVADGGAGRGSSSSSTRRSSPAASAPTPDERPLDPGGAEVIDVDRGGKITFHGPGQLVGYPIVRLPDHVLVVDYVRRVEEALIGVCRDLGVTTARVPGRSGVWLRADERGPERKVAAIGIRVSRGVTMHGFALNCDVDLGWYDRFVPCGIADAGVTSLSTELGRDVTVAEVLPLGPAPPRGAAGLGAVRRDAGLRAAARARSPVAARAGAQPAGLTWPPTQAADDTPASRGSIRRPGGRVIDAGRMALVIETSGLRKEFRPAGGGAPSPSTVSTSPSRPAACTGSSGRTAPARPPPSGCCSGWPGRTPARWRCSANGCRPPSARDRPGRRRGRAAEVRPVVHRAPQPAAPGAYGGRRPGAACPPCSSRSA